MTVAEYLAKLPADRRKELSRVRAVVRKSLPAGYQETIAHGMIVWQVPLKQYPDTYNGEPLMYAALASQKNYMSLYLMGGYASPAAERALKEGFRAAGKKLDMGKSCIRFRAADDLALDAVGDMIAAVPVDGFIDLAESSRKRPR